MKDFSFIIKQLREKNGYTQTDLAEILGMKTYTTITKWESGDSVPKGRDIKRLAEIFSVTSDYLLGLVGEIENNISKTTSKLTDSRKEKILEFAEKQLDEQTSNKKRDDLIYLKIDKALEVESASPGVGYAELSDENKKLVREVLKRFLEENPDHLPKDF